MAAAAAAVMNEQSTIAFATTFLLSRPLLIAFAPFSFSPLSSLSHFLAVSAFRVRHFHSLQENIFRFQIWHICGISFRLRINFTAFLSFWRFVRYVMYECWISSSSSVLWPVELELNDGEKEAANVRVQNITSDGITGNYDNVVDNDTCRNRNKQFLCSIRPHRQLIQHNRCVAALCLLLFCWI